MRLEVLEARRLRKNVVSLRYGDSIRRYVESGAGGGSSSKEGQTRSILRRLTLRVEVDCQFGVVSYLLTHGVKMQLPGDARARKQQLAAVGSIHVVGLADCPLHQQARTSGACVRVIGVTITRGRAWWPRSTLVLNKTGKTVVHDLPSFDRSRSHLNCAHPSSFGKRHIGDGSEPGVLSLSRHCVIFRL